MGEVSPSDLMSLAQTTCKPQSLLTINYKSQNSWGQQKNGCCQLSRISGTFPPQGVPLSLNPGRWENRCGSRGQELKRCPPSRDCPSQALGAHPAVHTPSLPLLPLILTRGPKCLGDRIGVSGGNRGPGPSRSSGKQLQAGRNTMASFHPREQKTWP